MGMRDYLRLLLISTTLLLTSFTLAIALGEVILRLTHYGEAGRVDLTRFYEYDGFLGWRHKRNFSGDLITNEYHTTLSYNAEGFRSLERRHAKPENVSRVVVLGDSFVDGYTVQVQDRLTEVLEARLGPRFEVINLGVAGYSTDQELLLLEQEGWNYQPDVVVLAFYYNDVWGNASPYLANSDKIKKPVFVTETDGTLDLTNVPVPVPTPTLQDKLKVYALVRAAVKGNHSLYSLAIKVGMAPKPSPMLGWASWGPAEFGVYEASDRTSFRRAWAITQDLLRRMKQETAQRGARFVVFYVPTRVELSPEEWKNSQIPANFDPYEVDNRLEEICKIEGVEYIDPSERFRAAIKNRSLYYLHDPHWNAAGHRLAGEILAEYLRNN